MATAKTDSHDQSTARDDSRQCDPIKAIAANLRAGRVIWLVVGQLITGVPGEMPLAPGHLVFDAKRIRYCGVEPPPRGLIEAGNSEPDAVLPNHTVLPGLIDAHAHLFLEGGEIDPDVRKNHLARPAEELRRLALDRMSRLHAFGVLGMRDAGDKDHVGLDLARRYRQRALERMPYIDSPGAAIHRKGRYGGFMGEALEKHESPEACIEARVAEGADRIKLIVSGIIDFKAGAVHGKPQLCLDAMRRLVAAARRHGRQVFAHASGHEGIDRAIDGGVDTIEHGFFLSDEQLRRMRSSNIAWVPTFAPVAAQVRYAEVMGWDADTVGTLHRILDEHGRRLRQAAREGVTIIAGSDAGSYGVPHGAGLLDELEFMEHYGMSPLGAIQAATGASARRLAFRDPIGLLLPEHRARFLLTRHDPLLGVAMLRRDKQIIFDGALSEINGEPAVKGL